MGRLRRLEAMVGDLSSQVEQSTGIVEDDRDDVVPDPGKVKSFAPSKIHLPDHRSAHNEIEHSSLYQKSREVTMLWAIRRRRRRQLYKTLEK